MASRWNVNVWLVVVSLAVLADALPRLQAQERIDVWPKMESTDSDEQALFQVLIRGDEPGLATMLGQHPDWALRRIAASIDIFYDAGGHVSKTTPLTVVQLAVLRGTPAMVRMAIRAGGDKETADEEMGRPLGLALFFRRDQAIATVLLEEGADINAVSLWDRTYWAGAFEGDSWVQAQNLRVIQFLLAHGVDPSAHGVSQWQLLREFSYRHAQDVAYPIWLYEMHPEECTMAAVLYRQSAVCPGWLQLLLFAAVVGGLVRWKRRWRWSQIGEEEARAIFLAQVSAESPARKLFETVWAERAKALTLAMRRGADAKVLFALFWFALLATFGSVLIDPLLAADMVMQGLVFVLVVSLLARWLVASSWRVLIGLGVVLMGLAGAVSGIGLAVAGYCMGVRIGQLAQGLILSAGVGLVILETWVICRLARSRMEKLAADRQVERLMRAAKEDTLRTDFEPPPGDWDEEGRKK